MGDFNMPPGVNVSDIPGYDDEEIPIPHCCHCGGFIPRTPSRKIETVIKEFCDGKKIEWKHDYDESLIRILGEEYRGQEYSTFHFRCEDHETHETTPDHEPHFFDFGWNTKYQSLCRKCCRYTTIEEDGY